MTPRMVLFCLIAGFLPLAAGLALAWLLFTRTGLGPGAIVLWAAAAALPVLAAVVVAAALAGREIDRQDSGGPSEPIAPERVAPAPPPREILPDLGGLAEALAAERRGPPGPALRMMLQYFRPAAHRPRLVDVNAAVEVCVRAMQSEGGDTRRLSFDPDPNAGSAMLDPDTFHQLLLNLILNAREAAGPSGQVDVRTQAMDGTVLVAVRDDGPGVPAGEIERIFEPFVSSRKGAAGLGLALCRRIALAHGATLTATNVLPRGLEVGVRLPQ